MAVDLGERSRFVCAVVLICSAAPIFSSRQCSASTSLSGTATGDLGVLLNGLDDAGSSAILDEVGFPTAPGADTRLACKRARTLTLLLSTAFTEGDVAREIVNGSFDRVGTPYEPPVVGCP
jgi:hypothetical protein